MATLKMLSRISSLRSILTAAFYTACWSHPRCWARATENRLPLNPSSCSFLKWEDECISPSLLLLQYFSLPQESSPSFLDGDEWEELSCHTSQVGSASWSGAEVPKALRPALPHPREVTAVMLQQNAGNCSVLSQLRGQCWGEWRHQSITSKGWWNTEGTALSLPQWDRAAACWELQNTAAQDTLG